MEVGQEPGAEGNPQAARMFWMEQELAKLKRTMEQQTHGREPQPPGYWGVPVQQQYQKSEYEHGAITGAIAELCSPRPPPPPPPPGVLRGKVIGISEESVEERLRSITIQLPKLADASEPWAALRAGDWLSEIRPLIADVSEGARSWWDGIMEEAYRAYQLWLQSGPLQGAAPKVEKSEGHARLETRVV